jgi:hypothetical protein
MSLDPRVNGESCVLDVVVNAVDVVLALVDDFAAAAAPPTPIAAAELCPSCIAVLGVAVVLPKYASSVVLLVAALLLSS